MEKCVKYKYYAITTGTYAARYNKPIDRIEKQKTQKTFNFQGARQVGKT